MTTLPMPSPNGTNHAGLYINVGGDMAYDAKHGRADHFSLARKPASRAPFTDEQIVAKRAHWLMAKDGPEPKLGPTMAFDADEPDDNEDDDDYESRQIQKICSFVRDNLSSNAMGTLAKHLNAHRELKQQEEASGMVGDDPPPFKGRPEPGGTMTGDAAYGGFIRRFPDAHRIGLGVDYGRQPRPPVARSGSEENFLRRFPDARRIGGV